MPAISKDQSVRESVGAFARICANVGMFAMVLIYLNVPSMFSFLGDNARDIYFYFAIIVAVIMWIFQTITLIGVKEDRSQLEKAEHTTLKDLWRALAGNDQVKPSVAGKQRQHMVQKTAAGIDLGNAGAVQVQCQENIGFRGGPLDIGSSHTASSRISFMAVMKADICSSSPMGTRM